MARKIIKKRTPLWFSGFTCLYALLLAALTTLNLTGADRWWWGAFNQYLPQAIWLVPGLGLMLISLKVAPRWIWFPGICLLWVLGPLMDFCWRFEMPRNSAPGEFIRVMTWNAKHGSQDLDALIDDIATNRPDVVLLQDADRMLAGPLGDYFQGWHTWAHRQYIIASRFALSEREVGSMAVSGQELFFLRCRLNFNGKALALYNVHFKSPRHGLNAFRTARKRPWYLPQAVDKFEDNVEARLTQARALQERIRGEKGMVVVAGDLNSPDSSLACATLRDAGLHDAFAEAGRGYGYTYGHFLLQRRLPWLNFSWMRIDHVMLSGQIAAKRCWTGTAKASDHRPVIADLVVPRP